MQDVSCTIRHKSNKANLVNLSRTAKRLNLFIICYHIEAGVKSRFLSLYRCVDAEK